MAMLGLSAVNTALDLTDEQVLACQLAGGTREQCGMPAYCYKQNSWDPRSWYRGLLPQCQPISMEEQYVAAKTEGELACEKADDPGACLAEHMNRMKASGIELPKGKPDDAASGECEYRALEEHPTLAHILSPEAVCKFQKGEYTLYLVAGGAALLWLLTRGR